MLLVIEELFNLKGDDALKAATGFAGGMGRMGSLCGGLSGGVMAFSLLYGRDQATMKKGIQDGGEKLPVLIKRLCDKFQEEYGSFLCDDIEKKVFGRSFDKWNPAEREEKERMGAHVDKCPTVVGKAARWVAELILDEEGKT